MLTLWGTQIISGGGMWVAYQYYSSTPDFIPNPDRSTFNGNNKTGTIVFLSLMIISILAYIGFTSSFPFKKPLYYNRPVTIWLVTIFSIITLFFFLSKKVGFL
jgi:hypothetical protein